MVLPEMVEVLGCRNGGSVRSLNGGGQGCLVLGSRSFGEALELHSCWVVTS